MLFADWRSLLQAHVTTHEELHILLYLRAHADRQLTAEEIARGLGFSERICSSALRRFSEIGLATQHARDRSSRFSPITESLARDVEALDQAYRTSELTVIRALNESAVQRVRASVARTFPGVRNRKPED